MIVHHQQAVDMGALVPERTERDQLERFARYVADAQRAEIRMMEGMIDAASARGLAAPEHQPHADPPMAGMLSSAQMAALQAASGAQFERLWLEGMIFHHDGGLAMARAQELQQLRNGRRPPGLEVLVQEILDVQRAEISIMSRWLEEWRLADADGAADSRPPDVEVVSPAPGAALVAGETATLSGVAVDDRDLTGVDIAIHDLDRNQWLRADGTWGAREPCPARLIGSGPGGGAWTFSFTPPAPGRYAVTARAEDAAGNVGESRDARELGVE